MKKYAIIITCLVVILTGCEKMELSKTEITFQIIDETGDLSNCNLRIIEPNPDNWKNVYSHMINLSGESSFKFEDVNEGNYAALVGNIRDTYKPFSISEGKHVKITYTYYVSSNITVGNSYSGYYTVPYKSWKCQIDLD
jgi:hypothetical protein